MYRAYLSSFGDLGGRSSPLNVAISLGHCNLSAWNFFAIEFSEIQPSRDVADIAYIQNQRIVIHKAVIDYKSVFSLVAVSVLFAEDGFQVTKVSVE